MYLRNIAQGWVFSIIKVNFHLLRMILCNSLSVVLTVCIVFCIEFWLKEQKLPTCKNKMITYILKLNLRITVIPIFLL